MNALGGRIWCGYLCPQTVWTDLFYAVERRVEGDRRERLKAAARPMTAGRAAKRVLKHAIWLMIAWWTGGAWVLYFADAPTLVHDLATFQAPATAYIWIGILTASTYLAAHPGRAHRRMGPQCRLQMRPRRAALLIEEIIRSASTRRKGRRLHRL
ncbi:4Fe-4S binding protein [Bradyrhizobium sp. C9]|uniref:4Fe-4S binding protein n=1 Tax=Bradyrhizobium sp. C9 TaxID=142585 RepID=UPI001FE00486|nr:4Fe-4S binding protein [Bradyrhizobium sp. C9]